MQQTKNLYTLLSIDAWHDSEGGWTWNNMFNIENDIYINEETANSPRALLSFMRRNNWLTENSKGKLRVEDTGYDIEIQKRGTYEPILAFRRQWPM